MNTTFDLIHRHRGAVLPVAVMALAIAIVSILWNLYGALGSASSPPRISQSYFYDLNTCELFTAAYDEAGPLETASGDFEGGPAGVRAVVFSCGSCNDAALRYVGWLEMPAVELESPSNDPEAQQVLIRHPDGSDWYAAGSREAHNIKREAVHRCRMLGAGAMRYCHPPSALAED